MFNSKLSYLLCLFAVSSAIHFFSSSFIYADVLDIQPPTRWDEQSKTFTLTPEWSKNLLENLIRTNGQMPTAIQPHFIICSEVTRESVRCSTGIGREGQGIGSYVKLLEQNSKSTSSTSALKITKLQANDFWVYFFKHNLLMGISPSNRARNFAFFVSSINAAGVHYGLIHQLYVY